MKVLLTACILLSFLLSGQAAEDNNDGELISLAKQYIDTEELKLMTADDIRAVRFEGDDNQEYYFIQSNDYVQIEGYEGITNLAVIIDHEGRVESVTIIDSEETPYFIRRIKRSDFLDQFEGYPDIDSPKMVTGATVSCEAIMKTVNKTVEIFNKWLETTKRSED